MTAKGYRLIGPLVAIDVAPAAYQEFFGLWKDADSDIPILRDARLEYAKLQ